MAYCVFILSVFFFFKQKTAYDMRISDWSSDVCASDLLVALDQVAHKEAAPGLDLADFVEAHHRRSKGTQVDFGRAALVPTPAPNIVINNVPVPGFDGAREQILERASPQHAGPMIADDVCQLVRFE